MKKREYDFEPEIAVCNQDYLDEFIYDVFSGMVDEQILIDANETGIADFEEIHDVIKRKIIKAVKKL